VFSFNLKGWKCPFPPYGRPWSEVMTTFFWKISAKCTNFEVPSLGLELQVSSLGVFDEVSVSSRNFNQVSVSFSKVTVSTSSLPFGSVFNAIAKSVCNPVIPPPAMPCTTFCFVCFYRPAFCRVCVLILWTSCMFINK